MTAKQAAEYLGLYEKEALELMQQQEIKSVFVFNQIRTTEKQIEIFLNNLFKKR